MPSAIHGVSPFRRKELRLGSAGGTLIGRVRGPEGLPVEGALVRAARHPRAGIVPAGGSPFAALHPGALTRTAADGSFRLDGLPPGALQAHVRARGMRGALVPVRLAAGGERRLELRLDAGAVLRGAVKDADGGPLADALVIAQGLHLHHQVSVRTARRVRSWLPGR